jgi:hypothetical protein
MTSRKNQDKEGIKPAGESEASVNPKRRRLIKGLAAATPGIFTLHSGAAQAILSSRQCTAMDQETFKGLQPFAGEEREVDGFVRLAEQDAIYVVRETQSTLKEKWLVSVLDMGGEMHYIEATQEGVPSSGVTWKEVLNGKEWRVAEGSGAGLPGSPLKLYPPGNSTQVYTQKFDETKTMYFFACVDDEGNLFSAYPQECDAQGFAPPSGSCWASIGTSTMNHWWG